MLGRIVVCKNTECECWRYKNDLTEIKILLDGTNCQGYSASEVLQNQCGEEDIDLSFEQQISETNGTFQPIEEF